MTVSQGIPLPGCRHDVLGHALKAIGVLRAISECASREDCDPSAEGWWDPETATFAIRSDRYPDAESLARFFAEKYRPTPMIAPWNKGGGITDKIEVAISGLSNELKQFAETNSAVLKELGLTPTTAKKQLEKTKPLSWSPEGAAISRIRNLLSTSPLRLSVRASITAPIASLKTFLEKHTGQLESYGFPKGVRVPKSGRLEVAIAWEHLEELQQLLARENLPRASTRKESAKKDGTLPGVAKLYRDDAIFSSCLELARRFASDLQPNGESNQDVGRAFLRYRDQLPDAVAESFDALCSLHLPRDNDNPLFVRRGRPGDKVNADIFLNFWDYFIAFRESPEALARASLFAERMVGSGVNAGYQMGKGTPFFPDAIKSYNQGLDWVTEDYPFCPLDYLLAVEGALAMRGATSKTLGARSRIRAAFPFVFEGTETMTDEQGKSLRLASSFWLPIWARPTSYQELQSFVLDSQARLPSKDCRFSSDFARAVRAQGVDAGFFAFQEFRFKQKGANVPWTTAGRFVACTGTAASSVLNELLTPIDEAGFLNQFEFARESKNDLHRLRAPVLEAIEEAVAEPEANKVLNVLSRLADLNTHLAKSKTLREKVGAGQVTFVPPLRCEAWSEVLGDLDADPEFEIARALASIRGQERQTDGTFSKTEPFLGSLLPLQRGQRNWFLPDPPSPQAVWTGIDLTRDVSAVLARRVIDSAADFRPSLVGTCTARLATVLLFLRGELDDRRIARMVEALSLIDWQGHSTRHQENSADAKDEDRLHPLPVSYAAVRALIEIACDAKSDGAAENTAKSGPRAVVHRTVSLVSCQAPETVALGVFEALRRLAIVGVPNTYGEDNRRQKPKLAGRDVVALWSGQVRLQCGPLLSGRLAAAVLIPLDWQDHWKLFRAITLPQTTR